MAALWSSNCDAAENRAEGSGGDGDRGNWDRASLAVAESLLGCMRGVSQTSVGMGGMLGEGEEEKRRSRRENPFWKIFAAAAGAKTFRPGAGAPYFLAAAALRQRRGLPAYLPYRPRTPTAEKNKPEDESARTLLTLLCCSSSVKGCSRRCWAAMVTSAGRCCLYLSLAARSTNRQNHRSSSSQPAGLPDVKPRSPLRRHTLHERAETKSSL